VKNIVHTFDELAQ